ncbi:hypothetical protein BJF92_11340 [Rhizobium rhizosphaerae]|uniref:Uncharacterized protein n=1 Tax=Xaviernesmea rhizosphaerae TaxID=1672749 RepID=A0A1Q9AMV0_9HYPH|nr:hypothetical protein [Xaviernesmea rhizosphaerae]OLP56675.1 hypothetical protein BJF92_11340 [Xaviernesmea rhizosphaerae]
MRDVDPDFFAALKNARRDGIVPRRIVTITAKTWPDANGNTAPVQRSFWTDVDDVVFDIVSGITGQMEARTCYGNVDLKVSSIKRVSDLTIQEVTISASQIAPPVQSLIRDQDVRLGKVEIFDCLLSPKSRRPVSLPELVWLGEISGTPISTPSRGEAGSITIKTVSDAIMMLTRKNPAKSSYQEQKKRDGDEFGKYSNSVKDWKIKWGM